MGFDQHKKMTADADHSAFFSFGQVNTKLTLDTKN